MSDEVPSTPEHPAETGEKSVPRVRRISNPRPKKPVKRPVENRGDEAGGESDESLRVEAPRVPKAFPEFPPAEVVQGEGALTDGEADEDAGDAGGEWSEAEPATVGGQAGQDGGKRKRRRKKGKGGGQQLAGTGQGQGASQPAPEGVAAEATPVVPAAGGQPSIARPPQAQPQRSRVDADLLAKFAWKIYLAEVSEEGVALIGDHDARELSRRCFRLAEIFLEEQARRR